MTFPKRGGTAVDTRTGQAVRIAEESPGRQQWMVRPLHKDGYWTAAAFLEPGRDPHAWTYSNWILGVLLYAASVLLGYVFVLEIFDLGGSFWLAWGTAAAVTHTSLSVLLRVTGLSRP